MHARRLFARALPGILLTTAFAAADNDYGKQDGQNVHRCVGLHGEIVFAGVSCSAPGSAGVSPSAAATPAPPPAADSCPASRAQLRERVVAAIARHDPNALAGMLRWRGVGAEAVNSRQRTLRELARHALLGIDGDISNPSSDDADTSDASGGLHVRTGGGDAGGVYEHAFGVSSEGGCFWLVW